jgi:hypothetical protein
MGIMANAKAHMYIGSREDDGWCNVSDEAIPKEDSKPAVDPQDVDGTSKDKEVEKDTSSTSDSPYT